MHVDQHIGLMHDVELLVSQLLGLPHLLLGRQAPHRPRFPAGGVMIARNRAS